MAEMFKSISAFAEAGLFPLRVLYIKPPMPCTAPPARSFKSDDTEGNEEGNDTDDGQSTTDIIDEITGQMKLFDE